MDYQCFFGILYLGDVFQGLVIIFQGSSIIQ